MPDREEQSNDLAQALDAADANISDLTVKRTQQEVRVTFNLLDEDDLDLVRELADEHGYDRHVDGISLFDLHKELHDD